MFFFVSFFIFNFFNFSFVRIIFFLLIFFFQFSWSGSFLYFEGGVFVFLVFISLFIFFLILFSERVFFIKFFSFVLILVSLLFFFSINFFFLFIFFELSVFPIIMIILGYGAQIEKISSSFYLFFYSSVCSLPFLLVLFNLNYFFFFVFLDSFVCWEFFFFVCLFFLIKFPVYFLHFWLPKAHVEAPTSARMILAGLLLKIGTGGFFRVLNLLKFNFLWFFFIISFLGIILGCYFCLLQRDIKSLAAFSSINHISFFFLLVLLIGGLRKGRSVFIMVSHGFISTLMFFLVGSYFHLTFTRLIYFFSGVFLSDLFFFFLLLFTFLSNSGVPPSLSFFGEFFGIGVCFFYSFFFFLFLFFYFFCSFYYSVYLIVCGVVSKEEVFSGNFIFFFCFCLLFSNLNFFFFIYFFSVFIIKKIV